MSDRYIAEKITVELAKECPNNAVAHIKGLVMLLRQADKRIAELEANIKTQVITEEILELVNEQAEDYGLWFNAKYATEAYLQSELRRLHALIKSIAFEAEFWSEKEELKGEGGE